MRGKWGVSKLEKLEKCFLEDVSDLGKVFFQKIMMGFVPLLP